MSEEPMISGGYIRAFWPAVAASGGIALHPDWWSRPYEYAWAQQFIISGERVADIGSGPYQPFVDELVMRSSRVLAVDSDPDAVQAIETRWSSRGFVPPQATVMCADGGTLDYSDFDTVFCISTLEHSENWFAMLAAMCRARRLVLTFDVQIVALTHPDTIPRLVLDTAAKSGMLPIAPVDFSLPADVIEWNRMLRVFCLYLERAA